jgi:hypothetical protein
MSAGFVVLAELKCEITGMSSTRVWIPIGAALFVIALAASALVVPALRLLHLLQALIYVAIVILARRNSVWGLGAGATIAVVWNSFNLFVTHLIQAGTVEFCSFLRTGRAERIDTMFVPLGGIAHFILIIACLAALFDPKTNTNNKWWKFVGGGVIALGYLALIVVIAAPR